MKEGSSLNSGGYSSTSEFCQSKPQTGSALADEFLLSECGATITAGTARTYTSHLRMFVRFLEDPSPNLRSTRTSDVRSFLKTRAQNDRRKSTLSLDLTAIKSLYRWARLVSDYDCDIEYLYLDDIDVSRFITPPPLERDPLTDAELEALYTSFTCYRDRLMATIAAELGPRNIDIRRLKIDDVDLNRRSIKLTNTKAKGTYSLPLRDELAAELNHWLSVHRPTIPFSDDCDYLFPSKQGGQLCTSRFRAIIDEAAQRAGIQETIGVSRMPESQKEQVGTDSDTRQWKKVNVHVLRHTFNRLMEDADLPPEARRDALDHDSIETTEKYYSTDSTDYKDLIRKLLHGEEPEKDS